MIVFKFLLTAAVFRNVAAILRAEKTKKAEAMTILFVLLLNKAIKGQTMLITSKLINAVLVPVNDIATAKIVSTIKYVEINNRFFVVMALMRRLIAIKAAKRNCIPTNAGFWFTSDNLPSMLNIIESGNPLIRCSVVAISRFFVVETK